MYKVLDKTKELNLTNLKMICNDAIELNEYFKDGEISRIYLNSQTLGQRNVMQKDVLHITHSLLYISRFSRTMEKFTLKQTIVGCLHIALRVCRNLGCIYKMNLNLHDEDDEDNILTEYEKSFLIKAQESIVWKQNFTRIYKVLKENNITIVLNRTSTKLQTL